MLVNSGICTTARSIHPRAMENPGRASKNKNFDRSDDEPQKPSGITVSRVRGIQISSSQCRARRPLAQAACRLHPVAEISDIDGFAVVNACHFLRTSRMIVVQWKHLNPGASKHTRRPESRPMTGGRRGEIRVLSSHAGASLWWSVHGWPCVLMLNQK